MDPRAALCQCAAGERRRRQPGTMMTAESEAADSEAQWLTGLGITLRRRWWWLLLGPLLGLLAAAAWLRQAEPLYTAQLRVAPAPGQARDTGPLGGLGSLASLAGVAVDAVPATPFRLYVEGLGSREAARRLAADPALMHRVFAREWDAGAQRWHPDFDAATALGNAINTLAGAPVAPWTPPDAARLQRYLCSHLGVDQNPRTPVVAVTIDAADPGLARDLIARLHRAVDDWQRERAIRRTRQNIAYLTAKLPGVAAVDHRQALFTTLADQQQRLVLARNPAAFAAEPFGQIAVSTVPTRPRQLPVLAAGLGLGLLLALALAVLMPARRR